MFGDVFRGRRVLVTGHTGFKGSWLALWLHSLGAHVIGLALDPPTKNSHWEQLNVDIDDRRADIREAQHLREIVQSVAPEIVFHLAAQPLVRRSYREPLETWSTNIMGTAHVLEACRHQSSVRAIVAVTTDKCYENKEWLWGYRESDTLGGHDPYSASKAAMELLVKSYRDAFFKEDGVLLATARAGNVIGGGDWSEDRLIPDVVRSVEQKQPLMIRSPHATRPWQHVLESLSGYLCLGQRLLEGASSYADAWNFGPTAEGNCTVAEVLIEMKKQWPALHWEQTQTPQPHEANLLQLDSTKARQLLRWKPVWSLHKGLQATAEWYQSYVEQETVISHVQLQNYIKDAREMCVPWSHT